MAEKFVLHVGFHKTGTTALQHSLYDSAASLKKRGIFYPPTSQKAHHLAAWSLTERTWGWKSRGGAKTSPAVWTKFAKEINKKSGTVIASSEFFSELGSEQILRIKNEIKANETQIVFTIRPLVKMLASSYQQYLKYGFKANYVDWLHDQLDDPTKSKFTPSFWQRNLHGESIAKWASVFGSQNVHVVVVDDAQPNLLYEEFSKLIGLEAGTLTPAATGTNRSLSAEEVEFLQMLNIQYPKSKTWADYNIFIRSKAIKALTDSEMPSGSSKLLTPAWAQTIANSMTKVSVEQIKDSQVNVHGDLNALLGASVPEGLNEPSGKIQIQTLIAALVSLDEGVIRKMRWRTLVQEVVRRISKKFGIKNRKPNA